MSRDLLRRYPLFALLGSRRLDDWIAAAQELPFAIGETIFQERTGGSWAYLVLEGRVRILRRTADGREVSLGTAGPGEVFGDYALLPPHRNTATCRAADPTRLLRLPLPHLQIALSAHPDVTSNLKCWLRLHPLLHHLRGQAFLGFMSAPSGLKQLNRLQSESFLAMRTIQADGLAADRWYVIEQGTVALHVEGEPPRELGPGDCFGERALAGWRGLPVAVALTDTRCLCLPRFAFDRSMATSSIGSVDQTVNPRACASALHPWVGQQEEADCGVAALAMIAQYHRRDVPLEDLRRVVRLSSKGMSLLALQRLAAAAGLAGHAVRVDPSHLADVTLPAIAHFTDGHYVVLYERGSCQVVIGDPATGIVMLGEEEFNRQWSGCLLLLMTDGRPGRCDKGVEPGLCSSGV